VDLLFVAANQSGTDNDRLVGITSDTGTVTLSPADPEIPASRSLIVGKPDGVEADALQAVSTAVKANATVKLTKPLANALTYEFTFKFERAGALTLGVPVTAGDAAQP
jgi:hypothetical protein